MSDLAKETKNSSKLQQEQTESSKDLVGQLSNKLRAGNSQINVEYQELCFGSLYGEHVEMSGRPLVKGGVVLETSTGEQGLFFDEPTERKIIRNWQQGIFSDKEKLMAELWRKITTNINLEWHKETWKEIFKDIPKVKTIEELKITVDKLLDNPDTTVQFSYLNFLINRILLTPLPVKNHIVNKWLYQCPKTLKEFAPYAYYCFRVNILFYLGLANDLITTKSTNVLDLQYLHYLPFCWIFSSGDKLHKDLGPSLLRNDQQFVDRELLKKDLAWLAEDWDSLDEKGREARSYDYGPYPPNDPHSFTSQMWKKYMRPWKPGSGNIRMNKERENRIMEELKPFMDAIEQYENKKKGHDPNEH